MVMLEDPKVSWIRDRPCLYIYFEKTLGDAFELWCWRRLLRVPWTCKEIQPVHPKGNQSWVFIGRTDAEAETPVFWPPDGKSWLIGKTLMLGGIGGGRRRGRQRVRWLESPTWWTWVWVNSRSWWWTGRPGSSSPWGCKESDTTERLNWTELLLCDLKEREMNFTVHISICKYSRYKKLLDD